MKLYLSIAPLLLSSCSLSFAANHLVSPGTLAKSRLVIFGDSLSDTGNYPSPRNVIPNTVKPIDTNFNIYIPISNPVPNDHYGQLVKSPTMPFNAKWFYPSTAYLTSSINQLDPQTGKKTEQGEIEGNPKALYSINWPLYLTYNIQKSLGLTNTPLTTWNNWFQNKDTSPTQYLNYAFASATSTDQCNLNDYTPTSDCDASITDAETKIQQQRNIYINDPNATNFNDLRIPGLLKQIDMYKHDIGSVNNVNYIIYIGGNDLASVMKNDLFHLKLNSFWKEIGNKNNPGMIAQNVQTAVQKIESLQASNKTYKIYILTYPNIADTPLAHSFSRWPVQLIMHNILSASSNAYNSELTSLYGDNQDQHVQIINVAKEMKTLATSAALSQSVKNGNACIGSSSDYINPTTNCNTYYAWNKAHFTTLVNAAVANTVYNAMITNNSSQEISIHYPDNLNNLINRLKN